MNSNIDTALGLASAGWYLIPVAEGKKPRLKDWQEKSSCDAEQIREWNRMWPGTAFGVHISRSGLAVVDLDVHDLSKNGLKSYTAFAKDRGLDPWSHPCVRTPSGGVHIYFRNSPDCHREIAFLPGVDLIAGDSNAFTVAPGMTVASGFYAPCEGFAGMTLEPLPEPFLNGPAPEVVTGEIPEADQMELLDVWESVPSMDAIPSGNRDNGVFRLVAAWKDRGFSEAACLRLCRRMLDCGKIDQSPDAFGDPEFYRIIGSAFRRPAAARENPLDALTPVDASGSPQSGVPSFAFSSMAELRNEADTPRETLVQGFMAHGKYLTLVYGQGGVGKSLLEMQMARELVRGLTFLGLEPGSVFRQPEPARIGILSMEEPKEDVAYRYARQSLRIDPEGLGPEPVWCNLRGANPDIFRATRSGAIVPGSGYDALLKEVLRLRLQVLFVDSLSRFFPGNENDRAAVTMLGILLDQFTETTGCHVIVLAHTNKAGAFSGSSSWEAICRQMFVIRSEKLGDTTVYTMTADKTNEAEKGAYVRYRWDDWYFLPVSDEEYSLLKTDARSRSEEDIQSAKDTVLSILGTDELKYGALREAAKEAGVDKGALDFALSALEADSLIVQEKRYDSGSRRQYRYIRAAEDVGF